MDILKVIVQDRQLINAELARIMRRDARIPVRLRQAMRYCVLGKGKRLRPILTLESFKACGGSARTWIMPFCCGIELIHNFSLIHDDLPCIDNDDLRRGQPTLHKKFDEATAILAGDALLAFAFELFACSRAPLARRNRAIMLIARAIGPKGMAGGQVLDIFEKGPGLRIARLKTGELIAVSIVSGGVIAGVSRSLEEKLYRLGLDFATEKSDRQLKSLRADAELIARRTRTGFSSLGREFNFFAELPTLFLKRRE
jgi:geranylgeranyl diphosphate synthase type II